MNIADLQYLIGVAGTVAFSATAVAAVAPKRIDLTGAVVMGLITSIGGGTLRDMILNETVFWASDLTFIWVSLVASTFAFIANKSMTRGQVYRSMLYLDGLGAALFAIQASHKAIQFDFGMPLGPILLGVLTAIGGGVIRDTLAGNATLLMRPEIYATPLIIGCIIYSTLLNFYPTHAIPIGIVSTIFIFSMRAAAIYWGLSMPDWMKTRT